jgi:hypothetical protein
LFKKLTGAPNVKDKLHVKFLFEKEQVQNEESLITRLNVYLENVRVEGFLCLVFFLMYRNGTGASQKPH